jgi:hypothetical protein
MSGVSLGDASTIKQELLTRGKFALTPDFGAIVYGFLPKGNGAFTGVAPYIGIQINFRSFDKDISFREYTWSMRRWYKPVRWSGMIGLSFNNIQEAGKRENFFGKNNFLLGIGYKLSPAIKIITGGMFFKQYESNYLSQDKKLAVTPYAGISIDADLRTLFQDITNVFMPK